MKKINYLTWTLELKHRTDHPYSHILSSYFRYTPPLWKLLEFLFRLSLGELEDLQIDLPHGTNRINNGDISFVVWAPHAKTVKLELSSTGRSLELIEMERGKRNYFYVNGVEREILKSDFKVIIPRFRTNLSRIWGLNFTKKYHWILFFWHIL